MRCKRCNILLVDEGDGLCGKCRPSDSTVEAIVSLQYRTQPDREDRFSFDLKQHFTFPCGMCTERNASDNEYCRGCKWYY